MASCAWLWGIAPRLCLKPTTPLHAAGMRVEPPPSVATASAVMPAAVAAAAPPLDPPQVRSRFHGLRVWPNSGESVIDLEPNSGVVVLPIRIAPCARSRATATASSAGTLSRNGTAPNVVLTPAVLTRSLTVSGRPCSRPTGSPRIRAASAARASSMARSAHSVMKQFKAGCSRCARASAAPTSSTGDTDRSRMRRAASTALSSHRDSFIGCAPIRRRRCRRP